MHLQKGTLTGCFFFMTVGGTGMPSLAVAGRGRRSSGDGDSMDPAWWRLALPSTKARGGCSSRWSAASPEETQTSVRP